MTDVPLILIVDDNRLLQQVTARALSQAGYRTCTADDGQSALRLARAEKPDLILLDVVLPDIDGFEVCRQLKADPALTDCFIVMLSSVRIDSLSLIEGLEGGADGYIARPIPNDELLARVHGLLRIKQAEDRLRESEERYHTLIEQAADGIFVADANGKCIEVNSMGCALLGYARAEILQKSMQDLAPQDEPSVRPFTRADFQGGRVVRNERHLLRKDGSRLPVEISARILTDGRWQAIVRDITERQRTEEAMRRVSRLYAVLSQVNQAIVRVKEQAELFKAICRIAIEFGQFRLAWIGLIDAPTGRVKPIGHHGYEEGYLQSINIDINPASPFSQGPSGQAILKGKVVTIDDIETAPPMLPWRDEALKRGYRSSAAVPFHLKGEVIGALTLYASEPGFFSEEEQHLLEEIGLDISFALDSMAAQAEREQADAALRESETRFRRISAMTSDIAYSCRTGEDGGYSIDWMTGAASRITGYSSEEIKAQGCWGFLVVEEDMALFEENVTGLAPGSQGSCELRIRHKNGDVVWLSSFAECVSEPQTPGRPSLYGGLADITARKRAEDTLRRAASEYRALAENLPDLLARFDSNLRHIYVNPAAARAGILSAEQYPGKTIAESGVPAPVATEWEDRIRAVLLTGEPLEVETQFVTPEGPRFFHTTLIPERVEDGNVRSVLSLARDITERKRAEMLLRESRDRYEAIFEATGTATLLVEADTTIIMANRECLSVTGYRPEELLGTKWPHYVAPESLEIMLKYHTLRREEPGKAPDKYEAKLVDKQGKIRIVVLDIAMIPGAKQSVVSMLDITERKQAEEALRESEGRFREIFENMSSGVVVYEAVNGGEDFRINHFNRAAEKIESISRESVIGRTVCEAFPGVKALGLFEVFQRVWQTGNSEHHPVGFYRDDRIAGWRENYVARLPSGEVVAVYDDVTARKQAEEQIQNQLDELQRWQDVMLGREDRVQELKREVNELCRRIGETARYPSQAAGDGG